MFLVLYTLLMSSNNVNRDLQTAGAVTEQTMTSFAADIKQMMTDWDNATPAQREDALRKAAALAGSTAPLTNSPIRLSDVDFNTNEFERSHGRQPRGRGGWGFVAYEFSRANNYLDHVKWFNGTYQDAKRQARAAFAAEGVMEVVVCS